MKVLRGIDTPVPGERVVAVAPPLAPYTLALQDVPPPRKRLNLFTHRALTHLALSGEQRSRRRDVAWLTRGVAPGVITGLEVALAESVIAPQAGGTVIDRMLALMPGRATTPFGEDIELGAPRRIAAHGIDVDGPSLLPRLGAGAAADELRQRINDRKSVSLALLSEKGHLAVLPHAMVLTAVPQTIAIDATGELDSPCANAIGEGAFSELAWEDGFELRWVPWPADRSPPLWSQDGVEIDPRFRNRLAYAIFNAERETGYGSWPWETIGAPLALCGFDAAFIPVFADRGAVVRQGGGRPNRAKLVPLAGDDVLWQARVAQLTEHLAELDPAERTAGELAKRFDWLPPAGVLPKQAIEVETGRQFLFPPNFDVQAQPIPLDMVDALIAEASPLLPFNLSLRDQVQVLVPVAARYFEPDLLKLDERIHPLFDAEVGRLQSERLSLLRNRDNLRRRFDVLSKVVSGVYPSYPGDDSDALPDETGALDAMAFALVHRSRAEAGASETHRFGSAHTRLELGAADSVILFVYLNAAPSLLRIQLFAEAVPKPGEHKPPERSQSPLFVFGESAAVEERRIGPLPEERTWVRLEIPAAATGLAGRMLHGISFGVLGAAGPADVIWGYAGKVSNGFETLWITDALPPGAVVDADSGLWQWATQGAALMAEVEAADQVLGLPIVEHVRSVSEVTNLVSAYAAAVGGALAVELGAPDKEGIPVNPSPLDAGFDELITRLGQRIAAANDHVEFGFLRARTDIFRVRQGVLGTEQAGRLLTSPTAAELIQRNDNPVATEKEFADYFKRAGTELVLTPGKQSDLAGPEKVGAMRAAAMATTVAGKAPSSALGGTSASRLNTTLDVGLAPASTPLILTKPARTDVSFTGASKVEVSAAPDAASAAAAEVVSGKQLGAPLTKVVGPSVGDVTGTSLFGASLNTVTVGERLTASPAVVVQNAAVKGKSDFVATGVNMLRTGGVVIDDLEVFGFKDDANKEVANAGQLAKLGAGKIVNSERIGVEEIDLNESEYFKRGLDAIDNMVRFLRGVEIRVDDYRRLQNDATAARERVVSVLNNLSSRIAGLSTQLAQARHDLAVARALRAEEQSRIDALIEKRRAILAQHVPYVVFRRPRFTRTLLDVPVRAAEPAVIEDVVPRCRADTHAVPPELQRMVDTLKDVPARWFRLIHPLIEKFDGLDQLQTLVQATRNRLATSEIRRLVVDDGPDTTTGRLLNAAFDRHARRIQKATEFSARGLELLEADTWRAAVDAMKPIASIGDLIHGSSSQKSVTLAAAGELDDIAGVGACLYNAFCRVPPATRLRWAELFSELDAAVNLRSLTVLPGFGDERLGVDYIEWRQMQMMVDWLFSRIEPDPDAVAAISDLIRVALLLASHAPVKRIISARIKRPVPPLIGGRIDLAIDPNIVRIGMQVLVHSPATSTVVARAVVNDLAADGAVATIAQVMGPAVTLDASMRVQIQSGPAFSTPAAQASDQALVAAARQGAAARSQVKAEVSAFRQSGIASGQAAKRFM